MRYTHTITIATAITTMLAMGSCKKQIEPFGSPGDQLIRLSATFAPGEIEALRTSTRATVDTTAAIDMYFARADQDAVTAKYGPYGSTALKASRTKGDKFQDVVFEKPQLYLSNGRKTKLIGWLPVAKSSTTDSVLWEIDGSNDIMVDTAHQGDKVKMMTNFSFRHQLTQIQFWPYASTPADVAQWGTITKIEVIDQNKLCSYNYAKSEKKDTMFFWDPIPKTAVFVAKKIDNNAIPVLKANAVQVGESMMIEPQPTDGYSLTIRVTSSVAGEVTARLSHSLLKGKAYKVMLNMTTKQIELTASIAPWKTINVDAEHTAPENTVLIAGTFWTTTNLEGLGENIALADRPEDYGAFFKWGTARAYRRTSGATDGTWGTGTGGAATMPENSLTGDLGYDYVGLSGGDAPGDPCQKLGAGYKTPTLQQVNDLYSTSYNYTPAQLNGINGQFFGPGADILSGNMTAVPAGMIFLPAAGQRSGHNGELELEGTAGNYWQSTARYSAGYIWYFSADVNVHDESINRAYGCSVRCVYETPLPATVTIAGTQWLCGNLTADAQGATTGFTVEPTPQGFGFFWKWGSKYAYDRVSGAFPAEHWSESNETAGAATIPETGNKDYDYATASGISPSDAGPAGDPCQALGASYKTPTKTQWQALYDTGRSDYTSYKGVKGFFFGPSTSSCSDQNLASGCIFLPAAGYRSYGDGSLGGGSGGGYYWSSSVNSSTYGWSCYFSSGGVYPDSYEWRGSGFSVRCVQE